jgi:Cu/Ag efflux protein CusF
LNTQQNYRFVKTLIFTFLLGFMVPSGAETKSPLDISQHPVSPEYQSLFTDEVVPLDTQLSWKRRFLGDESFNAEESLPSTGLVIEQLSINSNDSMSMSKGEGANQSGFDTSGVVKQVKLSEGKVKIKHGPVERLGMPAMTMVFRVEDTSQLAGLEKGTEVSFNVDNTAAGFSITHIEASSKSFDTSGVVKQVKLSEGKVKIEHGPIDRLGMPGMTMMFRIEDPSQLTGLVKGSEVSFNVDNTAAGFSITELEMVGGDSDSSFDTSGKIKSIRASHGKVKIEHGPIDRLGMPAMTMMFKLKNPEMLEGLERDMQVEFDVENGAGGFEILRIKPVMTAISKIELEVADKRFCYAIGPFTKQSKALTINGRYQERGTVTKLTSSVASGYVGDMVYIDGHASRDAALSTAKELEANGISDYVILNVAGKRNILSLGIFGQKQNAINLKSRIEALNFAVKIESRYRESTSYWLHYEEMNLSKPPNLLSTLEASSGISLTPSKCKSGVDA